MEYLLDNKSLYAILTNAQSNLFASKKYKFEKSSNWRQTTIPDEAGVYALYEGTEKLIYVGETGNLRERMNEINRTVNHSFRKQLGANRFGGIKSKKSFLMTLKHFLTFFLKNTYTFLS